MSTDDVELIFAEAIGEDQMELIKKQLVDILPNIIPNSSIQKVEIRPYPSVVSARGKRTLVGHTFRLSCTCQHGNEQVIAGECDPNIWIGVRQDTRRRSVRT